MAHKRQEATPTTLGLQSLLQIAFYTIINCKRHQKDIPVTPLKQTDALLESSPSSAGMALGPHTEHMIVWPSDLTG